MLTVAQLYARATRAGLTDPAMWTPFGGSPTAIDGYFDAAFNPADGMEANRPCLRVPAAIVSGAQQGDLLTVGGVGYAIAEIALHTPDPNETVLWLRKT